MLCVSTQIISSAGNKSSAPLLLPIESTAKQYKTDRLAKDQDKEKWLKIPSCILFVIFFHVWGNKEKKGGESVRFGHGILFLIG